MRRQARETVDIDSRAGASQNKEKGERKHLRMRRRGERAMKKKVVRKGGEGQLRGGGADLSRVSDVWKSHTQGESASPLLGDIETQLKQHWFM